MLYSFSELIENQLRAPVVGSDHFDHAISITADGVGLLHTSVAISCWLATFDVVLGGSLKSCDHKNRRGIEQ